MRNLLVPPPIARPAIMASEGSRARGQDDLTHRLQDILKRAADLRDACVAWERATTRPAVVGPGGKPLRARGYATLVS